jgi:hypothetical protein
VVADTGAVMSVRSLINDVNAGSKFAVNGNVAGKMTDHIAAVAARMGYPAKITDMTPEQQAAVWAALDGEVRETDYELWRTKQVNDWLNGVWAQVYGTMYSGAIYPLLQLRTACRVIGPSLLLAWAAFVAWQRRREGAGAGAAAAAAAEPRLAGS